MKKTKEKFKVSFTKPDSKEDKELVEHIKSLNLNSVDAYLKWCSDNYFSTGLYKSDALRSKEISYVREKILAYNLELGVKKTAPLYVQIKNYFDLGEKILLDHSYIKPEINFNYGRGFNYKPGPKNDLTEFHEFLRYTEFIDKKTKILESAVYYQTIKKIFQYKVYWINDIFDWEFFGKNAHKQLSSLISFLFAKYPYPSFLNNVWQDTNDLNIDFFLWIVSGKNIRNHPKLPVKLTKSMANQFLLAPDEYGINQSLRYAQILSLGGDKRLNDAICETRLGRGFENEDFWIGVFDFFVKNPMLDRHCVQPIIDYIQYQKYFDGARALQPNFDIKGRNPEILLQDVQAWHRNLQKMKDVKDRDWKPCGVESIIKEEKNGESLHRWEMKELLTTRSLQKEGASQKHCVSSYANSCISGRCAIFSIRKNNEIMGTIEIIPSSRSIVQARGKCNALLKGKPWDFLIAWAAHIGYTVKCVSGN